jgi:hypothetical protein
MDNRTNHNGFASGHSMPLKLFISWNLPGLPCHTLPPTSFLLVLWFIICETLTVCVNECRHHRKEKNSVHCVRAMFIDRMRNYVLDDLIRVYILQPFLFLFGYLFPKSL